MKRTRSRVDEAITYVASSRKHVGGQTSEYIYTVWFEGNSVIDDASADELRELATCIQAALKETEKGGSNVQ